MKTMGILGTGGRTVWFAKAFADARGRVVLSTCHVGGARRIAESLGRKGITPGSYGMPSLPLLCFRPCFPMTASWQRSNPCETHVQDASPSTSPTDRTPITAQRYFAELDSKPEALQPLVEATRRGHVTLLYSARTEAHNNAVALKRYLEERLFDQQK